MIERLLPGEPEERLRINLVLPPVPKISGGPLAILEYANGLAARGHAVSVTTYADNRWEGDNPFPWFKLDGDIHYKRIKDTELADGPAAVSRALQNFSSDRTALHPFAVLAHEWYDWLYLMDAMPDCDLNIASLWTTAIPVYYSGKGKPVVFMQHYEEVFFDAVGQAMIRLAARVGLTLPVYKIANSSWLQKVFAERFGQVVPFSTNAINQDDFAPQAKLSDGDGILRVITYSRPEDWKGFPDAVAAMAKVREAFGGAIEWNVFGYKHPVLHEDNRWAPYKYHPKLSFKELSALYAQSDVALCPSWYESFPLPPLEAMASGTAVVTTADGTEDYAHDGDTALVVRSRDIDGMAAAVLRLLSDAALRADLVRRGLEVAATYTWDRAVADREKILLDIHKDRIGYDRFAALDLGLTDFAGTSFARAPTNVSPAEGLFWDRGGVLFLVQGGTRRHVTHPALIPPLLHHGWNYIDVPELELLRIPLGQPVSSLESIPRPMPA